MSSVHKQKGKPHWFCSFTDGTGRRRFVSTKTSRKREAEAICRELEHAGRVAKAGKLNIESARKIIQDGVAKVMLASGQTLPTATVEEWFSRWLGTKELESEEATVARYKLALDSFREQLGTKAARDLENVTSSDVEAWRTKLAGTLAPSTINTHLRALRACLNDAVRFSLIPSSPMKAIKQLKEEEGTRRPFTAAELKKIIKACGQSEWRGMVLAGLYTGQRLRDVAGLTWQQADVARERVWFVTKKTGKRLEMKMARPLRDYLLTLDPPDDPSAFLFPVAATTSNLSDRFYRDVLTPAGLVPPRGKKSEATGRGRTGKREVNPVTFHSLRHTFTTWLKQTGASEAMAMMIVGHDSAAVSRHYTHLAHEDTAAAIDKLPEVG